MFHWKAEHGSIKRWIMWQNGKSSRPYVRTVTTVFGYRGIEGLTIPREMAITLYNEVQKTTLTYRTNLSEGCIILHYIILFYDCNSLRFVARAKMPLTTDLALTEICQHSPDNLSLIVSVINSHITFYCRYQRP